jgi:hypothetical protein
MQPDDQNLDRVRDARGDDEADWPQERLMCSEHEDRKAIAYTARCAECSRKFMAARSPQDEGHEAGIEAARQALCSGEVDFSPPSFGGDRRKAAEIAITAYLACVSPSRDGTVAVEDVRALLEEARAFLDTRHAPSGNLARPANLIERIDAALAEHPEPDALGGLPPSQHKEDT